MLLAEQKSREGESEAWSRVRVVGPCAMRMLQGTGGGQEGVQGLVEQAFLKNKKEYPFHPVKVFTTTNCLAAIDSKLKLWALIDVIGEPICLSDMLRLKVHDLALHHTQMILSTSAGRLLLSWGGRKHFPDGHLPKVSLRNAKFKWAHYFQLHELTKEVHWHDKYYFAHGQKIATENLVYQLTDHAQALLLHPTRARIPFPTKLAGVSLGKYHNLAWDREGRLYSWGCRSIALGYAALPEEEVVEQPREAEQVRGHVIKAYAGSSYSLAVTLDGKLYEWGINKLRPDKEQVIFEPRQVPTPINAKLVDLKGCDGKFAVLSLTGELYVWGRNAKQLLGLTLARSEEDNTLLVPTLLERRQEFIVDFQVEENCLVMITTAHTVQAFSDSRRAYWAGLKDSIQLNLKGLPTKSRLSSNEPPRPRLEAAVSPSLRRFTDPIELAFERRRAKENYLISALEPDRTINYLMQPSERSHHCSALATEGSMEREKRPSVGKVGGRRLATAVEELTSSDFRREKEYVQSLVNKVEVAQSKNRLMRFNRNRPQVPLPPTARPNDSYDSRLEAVRRKRDLNEKFFIEDTLRKVENRSFEFRLARRCEGEEERRRTREAAGMRGSLQRLLVKQFLVRLLTRPVAEGREVKIATFARYLKLERIEKRIRGLFVRTRVKFNMRRLHQSQVFRFFLLTMTFQQYVKRFRLKKAAQLRKLAVGELFKGVVRQKLKIGLAACHFNVRKLQKFREWLSLVRGQRRRCLKYIWKVQVLSLMRVNSDSESSAICYLPRNPDQLTFEALYQEQVAINPLLRLANFLNHHSIFRIKTTIFQQLFVLSREERKQVAGKAVKGMGRSRRFRIKFSEEEDDKDRLNLLQTDIYPYSTHYNLLLHPKNYDITIPEIMKVSDRWGKEERRILDRHIDLVIAAHEHRLLALRRTYDRDLASFIARQYDSLSEKRWKYILEYNQLDHSAPRAKKEQEIRRLMRLIGAEKLLDNDCIPEKQTILDEVARRPDAPQPPNPNIAFGQPEFKKLFRAYYEAVAARAKDVRRTFL